MKIFSNDFPCPAGGLVIQAVYDEETKELALKEAPGYFYPSACSVTDGFIFSERFMKEHSGSYDSLESAIHHLKSLNCEVEFPA